MLFIRGADGLHRRVQHQLGVSAAGSVRVDEENIGVVAEQQVAEIGRRGARRSVVTIDVIVKAAADGDIQALVAGNDIRSTQPVLEGTDQVEDVLVAVAERKVEQAVVAQKDVVTIKHD
ncbi:hypothetical protein D3C83_07840 [compost metagenome]